MELKDKLAFLAGTYAWLWLLQDGQLEGPPILDEYDVTTQLGKDFKPVPQK